MEIEKIKVLRGPNYWSNYRKKLIVLKLNLLEYELLPTNLIKGFPARLKALMPSLHNHRCSNGAAGGFFKRLETGTWLGHVIEHIALELQWLAGMECGYGRTRPTSEKGVYHVVFSYQIEKAGLYAAHAAVRIAKTLALHKDYENLEEDLNELKRIFEGERLGPSTESIVMEAEERNIPYTRLDEHSLIMLGHGCNQKIICSTLTSQSSSVGVDMVADKEYTKKILADALIPIPKGVLIRSLNEIDDAIQKVGFPLVVKPQSSNHGKGITTNITSRDKAINSFKIAQSFSENIVVEKFVEGFDYRLLVINYKLVAVAKRIPAMIIGTGNLTIQELIDQINNENNRGEGHQNYLSKIKIDDVTRNILLENGLSLDSILPEGKILYLKYAANISTGGTAIDVTDEIHPNNIFLAERIARLVNLDICGIDIVTNDISFPLNEHTGAVIEVNAAPGFRMHLSPTKGTKRNVAKHVIDMLYPKGEPSRIPLVAVTGTNGKTTVVRLIAYFARQAGHTVGFTSTEGIYIQNQEIYRGDCSGPLSASVVLRDPIVDFAVFECARGGILRSGLGFDQCSISIVTNVSEDHLGLDDIHTLEEMARVKSVVPMSTLDDGYAILNADDDLVYDMKKDLSCNVALFSMLAENPRILEHCEKGYLGAYIENGFVVIQLGNQKIPVAKIDDVPITYSSFANSMIKNILPAVLAGVICRFSIADIAKWLYAFKPSPENTPGRMNLFNFERFKVLIDYAHNEEAFIELRNFMKKINCGKKVGIIAATGDRRTIDIKNVGFYAAQTFDEIIIRQDKDSRGRTHEELNELIIEGIKECNNDVPVKIIPNEFAAIQYAMDHAELDTFIMYFPDNILDAVEYVKRAEQKQRMQKRFFVEGQASL